MLKRELGAAVVVALAVLFIVLVFTDRSAFAWVLGICVTASGAAASVVIARTRERS